ncbi:Clp protease N-terminal domain-containing protein [Streptomyces sp. NPDC029674]|uniref:Clp protease N-terminal domain-containing protein n=1 Tax=Streptomyces sp. NPDC029674 TaxID=3365297 RepID=UPI00384F7024
MADLSSRHTPRVSKILSAADLLAQGMGHDHVGAEHIFLAILSDTEAMPTQILAEHLSPQQVIASLEAQMNSPEYLGATEPTDDIGPPE